MNNSSFNSNFFSQICHFPAPITILFHPNFRLQPKQCVCGRSFRKKSNGRWQIPICIIPNENAVEHRLQWESEKKPPSPCTYMYFQLHVLFFLLSRSLAKIRMIKLRMSLLELSIHKQQWTNDYSAIIIVFIGFRAEWFASSVVGRFFLIYIA